MWATVAVINEAAKSSLSWIDHHWTLDCCRQDIRIEKKRKEESERMKKSPDLGEMTWTNQSWTEYLFTYVQTQLHPLTSCKLDELYFARHSLMKW